MGNQEAVEVLLDAGADPNSRDVYGVTALDVAEEMGAHDTVAVLLHKGAKPGRELGPVEP
jgi:ankyrin repeat protein